MGILQILPGKASGDPTGMMGMVGIAPVVFVMGMAWWENHLGKEKQVFI